MNESKDVPEVKTGWYNLKGITYCFDCGKNICYDRIYLIVELKKVYCFRCGLKHDGHHDVRHLSNKYWRSLDPVIRNLRGAKIA